MGIFDFFKKEKASEKIAPKTVIDTKTSTSNKLNLRKDKLKICLKKNDIENIITKVGLILDKSGSMEELYYNGTVQEVIERMLPLGIKFDDNGEIDIWAFNNKSIRFDGVGENSYHNFVKKVIMPKMRWGGTYYAEALKDVYDKYVIQEPSQLPSYIIFITDGETMDENATIEMIKKLSKNNIFITFIGIGNERFKFLQYASKHNENVDFIKFIDINKISDEELYDLLIANFSKWIKNI